LGECKIITHKDKLKLNLALLLSASKENQVGLKCETNVLRRHARTSEHLKEAQNIFNNCHHPSELYFVSQQKPLPVTPSGKGNLRNNFVC
jgi:hypothetical protein